MVLNRTGAQAGVLFGLGAYLMWGFLPLYFKAVVHVSPLEVVAHRVLWSFVLLFLLILLWGKRAAFLAAIVRPKVLAILTVTALLIAGNWLIYIHAIVTDRVLEASLGYFLNPLVNVLLGMVLLKERLTRLQLVASLIAGAGVAVLAAGAGSGLWISLGLAFTFGLYGLVRKVAPVEALEGLAIETLVLAPFALAWLVHLSGAGRLGFGQFGLASDLLLMFAGIMTAVPLLLFTAAARRLPYSALGFFQYLAPILQFLLAVFAFGEPLTLAHIVCFAAIWTALLLFSLGSWRSARLARAAVPEPAP